MKSLIPFSFEVHENTNPHFGIIKLHGVTVFKTNDPGLLEMAQSLLKDADIEFFVAGQAVSGLYPGGATGPYDLPEIRVAAQYADEARDLLKELA